MSLMKHSFCAVLLIFALTAAAGNAVAAPTAAATEEWAYNYPDAAFELWSWSKENPTAVRRFSAWDASNHERSKIIVAWAIAHPGTSIDVLVELHPEWVDFEDMLEHHRPAATALIAWCRHYPKAARAMMKSSRRPRTRALALPAP